MKKDTLESRKVFYDICQQVVDLCIEGDRHELQYGKPFGPVKPQHISAVITELQHYNAVLRIGDTDCFIVQPEIYRLYYQRYFKYLGIQESRAKKQFIINGLLVLISFLSAIGSWLAVSYSHS